MFCAHCGAKLDDDVAFCTSCGQRISLAEDASKTEPPNHHAEAQPNHSAFVIEEVKKEKRKKDRIVALAISIIALFGIAAFFIVRGKPVAEIALSNHEMEVYVGEKLPLAYTILPEDAKNKEVSWKSSDESVLVVKDSGEIVAVAEGKATVTVSATNGKHDNCNVSVKLSAYDYLKKLCVSESNDNSYVIVGGRTKGETAGVLAKYNESDKCIELTSYLDTDDFTNVASLSIPESTSGLYSGSLYVDYTSYRRTDFYAYYNVNARTLTEYSSISSYYCSQSGYLATSSIDEMYKVNVELILASLNEKVLTPNGYTLSDLGFSAY